MAAMADILKNRCITLPQRNKQSVVIWWHSVDVASILCKWVRVM